MFLDSSALNLVSIGLFSVHLVNVTSFKSVAETFLTHSVLNMYAKGWIWFDNTIIGFSLRSFVVFAAPL